MNDTDLRTWAVDRAVDLGRHWGIDEIMKAAERFYNFAKLSKSEAPPDFPRSAMR